MCLRDREQDKEGVSKSMHCTQLYNEMRFYPFEIVKKKQKKTKENQYVAICTDIVAVFCSGRDKTFTFDWICKNTLDNERETLESDKGVIQNLIKLQTDTHLQTNTHT